MSKIKITANEYPTLSQYGELIESITRMPIGREKEILDIGDSLARPEMNNVTLLAPAGAGKTALLEGYAVEHKSDGSEIFKIDLPTMAGDGDAKFAQRIKSLADDIIHYADARKSVGEHGDTVVFFDEMHLLTMNGNAGTGGGSLAGNALKPIMARGEIKIIGATTDEEYRRYVEGDAALTRRFQALNLDEVSDKIVLSILLNFAKVHLGPKWVTKIDRDVFKEIIVYTNRYLLNRSQPAKAIDVLDAAAGRYNNRGAHINHAMIADIFKEQYGVDVDWHTDIATIDRKLHARVIGQDLAIDMLKNRLYVANAHLQEHDRPLANFLFAGATGVGKTELAKAIAEAMFGSEKALLRFDMSEYSESSDVRLFHERLTDDVSKRPFTVLLIDEFEKAARAVMNLFLPVLDDGQLSNRYGRKTAFNNCIIIMTSNAASDVFKDAKDNGLSNSEVDSVLRAALGARFSPEFLGRFDEVIPFNVLDDVSFKKIANIQLNKQRVRVKKVHNVDVVFTNVVQDYLVYEGFDALMDSNAGGGRAMSRRVAREISPLIAMVIDVANSRPERLQQILITMQGDASFQHKELRVGNAYLEASFLLQPDDASEEPTMGVISQVELQPTYMTLANWKLRPGY